MIKSQRSDTEKNNLIDEDKRIGIDKIIEHNNKITDNNSKSQN